MNKIGLIIGEGKLPQMMIDAAKERNIDIFVVAIKNTANIDLTNINHTHCKMTSVGAILKAFNNAGVRDVLLAGRVRRPNFSALFPDAKGWKLLWQILKNGNLSDDKIFRTIGKFLENEDFILHGISDVFPELLAANGLLTGEELTNSQLQDVEFGFEVMKSTAKFDIGQALILQNKHVIGIEAAEGTNELIKRCGLLIKEGKGVLVKAAKPGQELRIDLPVIGVDTIRICAKNNISILGIQAGKTIIVEPEQTFALAKEHKISIYGVKL